MIDLAMSHPAYEGTGKSAIVSASGGLDSITLGYYLKERGYRTKFVAFDDGPKNDPTDYFFNPDSPVSLAGHLAPEATFYTLAHRQLHPGFSFRRLRFPQLNALRYGTADDKPFWVGFKPLMCQMLLGYGATQGAEIVALGHLPGETAFSDSLPDTLVKYRDLLQETYPDLPIPKLVHPFYDFGYSKADVIKLADHLKVPMHLTLSCQQELTVKDGGYVHCGTCKECVNRKQGFIDAGIKDPTTYLK